MSTDTMQKYRDSLGALMAPDGDSTSESLVDNTMVVRYTAVRGAVMAANVDSTVNSVWTATLDPSTTLRLQYVSSHVIVDNTVTAVNTNVAIFSLVYNDANGGSDTTIATINTATTAGGGSGDITAAVPMALTANTSNGVVPAGSLLAFKLTKAGAGGCATGSLSVVAKFKPI